jgi:enoyl-CoA hydratase/carnithine racemase
MDYSDILYEVDGTTAVITFNRPDKLNAWTGTMEREYRDALDRADHDRGVRVVILTGAGRGFCAGADMSTLNTIADTGPSGTEGGGAEAGALDANYQQHFSFPLASKKPLIGAINGAAVGLGMVMTLYCDIRFASDQARFGTAFSSLGLVSEHGVSWLLPRMIGTSNAFDMLYSARIVGAEEALRMGLVSRVIPHADLMEKTKEYATYIAEHGSPAAMASIKRLVYDAGFTDLASATQAANNAMGDSFDNPDFKEGLAAFAERRTPRFAPIGD